MANSKTSNHYVVISSDCHAGADVLDYKPYLERAWHDEFDAWAAAYVDPWLDDDPGVGGRRGGAASASTVTNWDSAQRLADLEADGIVAEVLFPNTAPPFYPSNSLMAGNPLNRDEYLRRWAGLRAHNRWLRDFCAEVPGRRAGMAQILLNDVNDAVEEIGWIKEAGLTGGILLPGVAPGTGLPPLFSPDYEPIWAACSDFDVTISCHSGGSGLPIDAYSSHTALTVLTLETRYFARRALWHLMFAGVFERYPNLRLALTEQGSSWVVEFLRGADSYFRDANTEGMPARAKSGDVVANMSLLPSEYFSRNCYLGSSLLLREEVDMRHQIGIDRIMWGSDYPHSEGSFPYSQEAMRVVFAGLPSVEVRKMLAENVAPVYGFDLDQLAPIAERVGPTVEEINTPLDIYPRVPDDSVAHQFVPHKVGLA